MRTEEFEDMRNPGAEEKVKNEVAAALDSVFNKVVVTEKTVGGEDDTYRIDVCVPKEQIAIECKRPKQSLLKYGVGQCIRYELDGWSSYLCTHHSAITDTVVSMCMEAGIGLIAVNDINIGASSRVEVYIQNRQEIPTTSYGKSVSKNISGHNILEMLEINTIDEVMELEETLKTIERHRELVDDGRWKDIRTRHDIFPEE